MVETITYEDIAGQVDSLTPAEYDEAVRRYARQNPGQASVTAGDVGAPPLQNPIRANVDSAVEAIGNTLQNVRRAAENLPVVGEFIRRLPGGAPGAGDRYDGQTTSGGSR